MVVSLSVWDRLVLLLRISRWHVLLGTVLSAFQFTAVAFVSTRDPVSNAATSTTLSSFADVFRKNSVTLVYYIVGNLAIQCQNQLSDEAADKVNKPYLPLPKGDVSRSDLIRLSYLGYFLYFAMTVYWSDRFLIPGTIAIVLATAYSVPPFRLKQLPLVGSACIVICRPICYHSLLYEANPTPRAERVWYELLFVILAVCVYKDVPDVGGDKDVDNILTLPMILGVRICHFLALGLIVGATVFYVMQHWMFLLLFGIPIGLSIRSHRAKQYDTAYLHIWNVYYLLHGAALML